MLQARVFAAVGVLAATAVSVVGTGTVASAHGSGTRPGPSVSTPCPPATTSIATCQARVVNGSARSSGGSGGTSTAAPLVTPSGLAPVNLTTAYGFSGTNGGAGQTSALVDAYDAPTIAANLTSFSTQFNLPACTTANGCFTKVNQAGGSTYPAATSGWDLEISLDVEWAHALAPSAKIMLVEASSASYANLFTAVTYAAKHAQYVSMSWGGTEFSGETTYDANFALTPSVSFFAASGDSASEVIYPSTSPNVVSVGGTTLTVTSATGAWKSESAWSTAGGGCSTVEKATAAQKAFPTYDQAGATCAGRRATPDVSLDANPQSGVAVYDSKRLSTGAVGWIQVGGTSASTVFWAAHSAETGAHVNSTYVYGANIPFYNVSSGSNGHPCEKGYNLCTGLGSWNTKQGSVNGAPVGSLSITSAAQTLKAGKPSSAVTVRLSTPAPTVGVSVKLGTTSAGGGFATSASGPFTHTLSVPVAAGATSASAYYEDTVAGSPTISATAAGGWTTATQGETVQPGTVAKITVSPASVTLGAGASQVFTASGADAYGNAVTAGFNPSWSTTTGGTLSATSGTSTKLTAPTTSVSKGSVTATQGGVQGSATVTVLATPAVKASLAAGSTTKAGQRYQVPLTVKATGTTNPINGATVQLTVYRGTCTGAVVATGSGKTGASGTWVFNFGTPTTGSYCAKATVTATGYTAGAATATFAVSAVKVGAKSARAGAATLADARG
jgi:subtilase family serine protease